MAARKTRNGSPWRLRRGESILSAARAIDTAVVKARLERFERAHHDYADAKVKVAATEAQLWTVEKRVQTYDAAEAQAVTALVGALIADGLPVGNPLAPYEAPSIGKLTRLPFAEEAKAVRELAAAVQRDGNLKRARRSRRHRPPTKRRGRWSRLSFRSRRSSRPSVRPVACGTCGRRPGTRPSGP